MASLLPWQLESTSIVKKCLEILFLHIVDSKKVADKIMNEVQRLKLLGRIDFLYLDRLCSVDQTFLESEELFSIINVLKFEPKYEGALKAVFGKTMVCTSSKLSSRLVDKSECNFVSMEGEQIYAKGLVMIHEFVSCSPTYLDIRKYRRSIESEFGEVQNELKGSLQKLAKEIETLDAFIDEMNTFRSRFFEAENKYQAQLKHWFFNDSRRREMFRRRCDIEMNNDIVIQGLQRANEIYEEALLQEFSLDRPMVNEDEVDLLSNEVFSLRQIPDSTRKRLIESDRERERLVKSLEFLFRRRDKLNLDLLQDSVKYEEELLRQKKQELEVCSKTFQKTQEALQEVERNLLTAHIELQTAETVLQNCKATVEVAKERLEKESTQIIDLIHKCLLLRCTLRRISSESSSLKPLSSDKLQKYRGWNVERLQAELEKLKVKLNGLEIHWKGFPPQNADVAQKLEVALDGRREIEKIIEESNLQRELLQTISGDVDGSNEQSFKTGYSKLKLHFRENFLKFIPEGTADLILKTADGEEHISADALDYRDCIGLAIRLTTNINGSVGQMCEFSDGVRTAVTLCLIFALQEVSPLQFVLLDEVDKTLIEPHAGIFYGLLRSMSKKKQIIATSRSEGMIACADQIYGVELENRVSFAEMVPKNAASKYLRWGKDDDVSLL